MAPMKVPCLLKIVLKCFKNVTPCCGELVTEAATRGVLEKKSVLKNITAAQLHSVYFELRFCVGSIPTRCEAETCNGENLLQCSRLEIMHWMKSVQIWTFFWSVFSRIQIRKNFMFEHFLHSEA